MRLPLIKHIVQFIEENDSDYIQETISVLENLTENSNIKDDEMDVIGEILSNLYGAIEQKKWSANLTIQNLIGFIPSFGKSFGIILNFSWKVS